MSGRSWSVGKTAEVAGFARASARRRDERLLLHVLVDSACPHWIGCAVRDALVPQRPGGEVLVYGFLGAPHDPRDVDAAIMLVGERSSVEVPLTYARRGIPVALVAEGALDAPAFSEDEQSLANVSVVAGSSREALLDKLSRWLCSVIDKEVALAANFPFCRDVVVDGMVRRCALQNAGVTVLPLVSGSDFPVMTANQMRLALDVSAAYGKGLEPSRALELSGVLGLALAWRMVSRRLVAALPGLGLFARAGIALGGTLLTGEALRLRFDAPRLRPFSREGSSPVASLGGEPLPPVSSTDAEGYVTIGGNAS